MPIRRRSSRRSAGKRRYSRRYRKAPARRRRQTRRMPARRVTRRRILNVSSIKKRDNMMSAVINPGEARPTLGPLTTTTGFTSLYIPTARTLAPANDQGESMRQRQTTYAVGYKERVQVDIIGGGVWKWRRIVFAYKGGESLWTGEFPGDWTEPFFSKSVKPDPDDPLPIAPDMVRLIGQPQSAQANAIRDLLWDGHEGVDWSSQYTAKVDTKRVRLMSDKTYVFNPGNESGMSRTYRFWYPIGHNIVYDDDEWGASAFGRGSPISVQSKAGFGDVYIYDIAYRVVPSSGSVEAQMQFSPEGTYYWHER
ncbi:capsid [uncultured virus]|uniref:Capsid n=1 Tax=uncultured virus TaxID=340016 RepID=A0A2K9LT49_9VIRU|nr:capsid [uncultured virus]